MFKQTSKQMQHSSCPESGRHLWLFSSRLSKHTLQTLQWNDLSLWILSEPKKKLKVHREKPHTFLSQCCCLELAKEEKGSAKTPQDGFLSIELNKTVNLTKQENS